MSRLKKMAFEPIDSEEKEILESLENGDWKPVKNLEKEKEEAVNPTTKLILTS
ncbi:MAG: hypothetical protein JKP90_03355 [Desulfofustis sp. PB-SRB1]|jgi:hypothetical protein|nr:hypothetical protein [Desulfofustis sp. PB-SRB1]